MFSTPCVSKISLPLQARTDEVPHNPSNDLPPWGRWPSIARTDEVIFTINIQGATAVAPF